MGIQKKHGKGRLDKWYKLAKEKGYRARAAFKLIQLNKKYGFLEKAKVLLDLCAAPGSWMQVAAETMPAGSLIVGCDLSPIKAIPKCISFQSDITTDKCRATIRQHFKTWKADVVLHDGAPNVGTAWVQDSFNQAELALQSMKLATEFLVEGGTFVTKVFRSKDYNSLLWVFNQLFTKVEATKPPSSRNVSAEIFVVCQGFKAPKKIDPKFLDPKYVFAELADPTPNNEAKVFNPEIKKRKRDGYEEGNWTQYKEVKAIEFIRTTDPIAMLGSLNKLSFEQPPTEERDIALVALEKLSETTTEIRNCCNDLRVLGRKEFRNLLKWRLKAREIFGLASKKKAAADAAAAEEEIAEIEPMDEELKIQEELQAQADKTSAIKKRERRRANEQKQKEIVRMQLHMTAPIDIGLDQAGAMGEGAMFALKSVDKSGGLNKIAKGKMVIPPTNGGVEKDFDLGSEHTGSDSDESDADEVDRLEMEMERAYQQYQEKKAETDAKYKAKKAREEHDDWEGFDAEREGAKDSKNAAGEDSELEEESDSEGEAAASAPPSKYKKLLTDLQQEDKKIPGRLSRNAAHLFSQDIFQGLEGVEEEESDIGSDNEEILTGLDELEKKGAVKETILAEEENDDDDDDLPELEQDDASEDSDDPNGFEVVKRNKRDDQWADEPMKDGRPDIDIITAEAMTMAQQLASGVKTKHDLVDENFNRYAFKDRDGLPDWFLEDESKHDRPHRPITKAGAAAIKEKMRALNARPIKKVREAKDRKKFHAAQRLEKLRKKSALLNDEEGMTEKEKANSITKLMSKAAKRKPQKKTAVVVAGGANKGQGRPRGVKGKYKMVDSRLKKDVRAEKRLNKKRK